MAFYRAKEGTLAVIASKKEQGRHHAEVVNRSCPLKGSNVAVGCGLYGEMSCQAREVCFGEVGIGLNRQLATRESWVLEMAVWGAVMDGNCCRRKKG